VPSEDCVSLARVFALLEAAKADTGLTEYSISQSTLEDVFLKFAAEQEEGEEAALQETAEGSSAGDRRRERA